MTTRFAASSGETVSLRCRQSSSKIAVKDVIDKTISGLDGTQIPICIYQPTNAVSWMNDLPIVIYCHGGGFFAGSLDMHNDLCRNLGRISDYVVV